MGYYADCAIDSWFDDEPYYDRYYVEVTQYSKYVIKKLVKETDKAWLFTFKSGYDAWVPKSVGIILSDNKIKLPDWFELKNVNQIKEIKMEFLNE